MIKHITGKKKGSTILMVLMISTILIIVSAVMMNSLIITTYANDLEKNESDYLYAAEGGIEYGVQKYKSTGTTGFPFTMDYLKTIDSNPEKGIKEVKVSLEEYPVSSGKKCIISRVYGKDDDELYKIILPVGESSTSIRNILKYSVCSAGELYLKVSGTSAMSESQIAHNPNNGAKDYNNGAGALGPANDKNPLPENLDKMEIDCEKPIFKEMYLTHRTGLIKVDTFEHLEKIAKKRDFTINESSPVASETENNVPPKSNPISVPYMASFRVVSQRDTGEIPGSSTFEVILVNGDVEIAGTAGYTANNRIYIINGTLKLKSGGNAYHLVNSTIYAKNIIIEDGSTLTISYSPLFTGPGVALNAYSASNKQIRFIDTRLTKYMTNWGASGSGGSGGSSGDIKFEDIEYIN